MLNLRARNYVFGVFNHPHNLLEYLAHIVYSPVEWGLGEAKGEHDLPNLPTISLAKGSPRHLPKPARLASCG